MKDLAWFACALFAAIRVASADCCRLSVFLVDTARSNRTNDLDVCVPILERR